MRGYAEDKIGMQRPQWTQSRVPVYSWKRAVNSFWRDFVIVIVGRYSGETFPGEKMPAGSKTLWIRLASSRLGSGIRR